MNFKASKEAKAGQMFEGTNTSVLDWKKERDRESGCDEPEQNSPLFVSVIYRHSSIHPVDASFHILCPQISLANWIGNMWAVSSIKRYSELGCFPAHFNKSLL